MKRFRLGSVVGLSLGVIVVLLVAITVCDDESERYRDFSAQAAVLTAADVPPGWEFFPSEDLPDLRRFFPPEVDLEDSAVVVANNGAGRVADLEMIAVGVTLLSGDDIPPLLDSTVIGLAFLTADPTANLSNTTILEAVSVDSPTSDSVRLRYTATVHGENLITEAINFRDGRVAADVEIAYPNVPGYSPALDLEELASLVHGQVKEQLR